MDMLITMRVSDAKPGRVVAGSVVKKCSRCGLDVYVSPTSLDVAATVPIACTSCIKIDEVGRMQMRSLPGQMEELQRYYAGRN